MSTLPANYAVFGNPIAHSRSPQIHTWFAEQTGQNLRYTVILAPLDEFETAAIKFFTPLHQGGSGGQGANVTVPFKLDALVFADKLSPRARRAGAVNTLQLGKDGLIYGDNTDGVGLVQDITVNLGFSVQGKTALLLGAGGAARGVIEPLLKAGLSKLTLANRTVTKAQQLVQIFAPVQPKAQLQACSWEALAGQQFDLIINATSASLSGELPPLPSGLMAAKALAYDLMYASQPTPFMQWAQAEQASHIADGLGMLVEQAAEAFYLWRQVKPATAPVIQRLRQELQAAI